MPISRAFFLLLLFVGINCPAAAQAQDTGADEPVQATPDNARMSAEEATAGEPPALPEKDPLAPSPGTLSLYSSDALVDTPYVYPLLRMRLTPEMRQGTP